MTLRWRITVVTIAAIAPALLVFARQQDVRDGTGMPLTGTASISGVVVGNDEAAQPVRRVTMNLNGGGLGRGARGGGHITVSDDNGAFSFPSLPSGRYTLGGVKPGWLGMQYGATRYGSGGITMVLAEGQHLTLRMKMTHGAAITGQVLGEAGYLPDNVRVRAETVQMIDGERHLTAAPGLEATADERGIYRIFGLPPGDYVVSASFEAGFDIRTATQEELLWAQKLLKKPITASAAPTASSAAAPLDDAPAPGARIGYASVYFPGSIDPSQADIITLPTGGERRGADIRLHMTPLASVRMTLRDPDGRAVNIAQVALRRSSGATPALRVEQRNGSYVVDRVPPGTYRLSASSMPENGGKVAREPLWGSAEVTVDGRDVALGDIALQPGMTLTGRLALTGASSDAPFLKFGVSLQAVSPEDVMGGSPVPVVAADGTFTVTGIPPGRYVLRGNPIAGWSNSASTIGDRDALDTPIEIAAGQNVTGAVVTFAQGSTNLSGTMLDASGAPTADYYIVVFTTQKELWRSSSRWIVRARPGTDGKWQINGLPPGTYYLAAATDVLPTDLADPAFLAQLVPASMTITLGAGEKKVQDLKAGR